MTHYLAVHPLGMITDALSDHLTARPRDTLVSYAVRAATAGARG